MIEFLIVMLAIGFGVAYFVRHPLITLKYVGAGISLMLLGCLTIFGLLLLFLAIG